MDYKYIRAWGSMLESFPSYIENEVKRAQNDKAPQTAIYRKSDGTWAIFEDIQSDATKTSVAAIVAIIERSSAGR